MQLLKCILTENDCYKTHSTMTPKGVMVHSTGANNPTLRRYVQPTAATPNGESLRGALGINTNSNDWNRSGINACVHAFIGRLVDGSVAAVQTLPWNHRGWHAGIGTSGRSANDGYIAFEMCEDDLAHPGYFAQAYQAAVELTAYLCRQYRLDPRADGVVICHQDGYQRGIASNHADVYNWFSRFGRTMEDFRVDVARIMEGEESDMVYYRTLADVPKDYEETIRKLVEMKALKGCGMGVINVSEDMCRIFTVLDRLSLLNQRGLKKLLGGKKEKRNQT